MKKLKIIIAAVSIMQGGLNAGDMKAICSLYNEIWKTCYPDNTWITSKEITHKESEKNNSKVLDNIIRKRKTTIQRFLALIKAGHLSLIYTKQERISLISDGKRNLEKLEALEKYLKTPKK
jgi:hypothetical protein